ncbi:DUF4157 domain-containing protein [Aetokthonos hydrillicola CCALA 1050]|nr:DUF4157 domain-containing protein [Aetokthonos hydrillicola CCALA 1050]
MAALTGMEQYPGHSFGRMSVQANVLQRINTPNKTGLPDALKAGVESLSGYSLNDVRVHYNSPKPAQLQALAYTQGTEIHVTPGQEEHLPHEAWHVVQQMQGRVKPTMQMKGVQINDDKGLEREAEVMGAKAINLKADAQMATKLSNRGKNGQSSQQHGVEYSSQFDELSHGFIQRRCETFLEKAEPVQRSISFEAPIQRSPCQGTTHDTSNEHLVIETDYTNYINRNASREFEIPKGSLDTNENGTHKTGYADIADRSAKELYEIKRATEAYPDAQLNRYIAMANNSCGQGWKAGSYYPNERIIDFSRYEANMEIYAVKDARPGFIRYLKQPQGGRLGIANDLGGGVYVRGMADQADLPPLNQWVNIWTQEIWNEAQNPETIDVNAPAYLSTVQQVQQTVQNVNNSLRGGMLDRDLLKQGWKRLEDIIANLPF